MARKDHGNSFVEVDLIQLCKRFGRQNETDGTKESSEGVREILTPSIVLLAGTVGCPTSTPGGGCQSERGCISAYDEVGLGSLEGSEIRV